MNKISSTIIIFFMLSPGVALAQLGGLENTAKGAGYAQTGPASTALPNLIGTIIGGILALIGLVFMGLVILGGFHILNSGGSEEGYKKGKDEIKNGVIGLAVIFAAYTITYFVIRYIAGQEGGLMNI